jgi:hypothetical protein
MPVNTRIVVTSLLGLFAAAAAGCGRPGNPATASSALSRPAGDSFPSAKDAAEAVRSPVTLPDRRAAAERYLRRSGKAAVPAAAAALPEPTEYGWLDGPLTLAEFIADFAPAESPEVAETRRKAEAAETNFRTWFDRKLKLMAVAGISLKPEESRELGLRQGRHEKLAQSLKSSGGSGKP